MKKSNHSGFFAPLSALLILLGWTSAASGQNLPPPDAQSTASGYLYVIHTKAKGKRPEPGSYVYFHAEVGHENRMVYNSRKEEGRLTLQVPESLPPDHAPAPIEETVIYMGIGDSATVWVPIEKMPKRPTGFDQVQYYMVRFVLLDISSPANHQKNQQIGRFEEVEAQTRALAGEYSSGKLGSRLSETASGLKYILLKKGEGPTARPKQTVWVQYLGMFTDGRTFDDSFRRGEALKFLLGKKMVIDGWDEGLTFLNPGAQAVFFIPAHLAYGKEGAGDQIPPDTELVFFIELEKVK